MDPIREYAYLGAILVLVAAAVWFTHHERVIGQQTIIHAQQAADLKEAEHVKQVTDNATHTIMDLQARLAASLATPPVPGIVVRVCPSAPRTADAARGAAGPIGPRDATGGPSEGVGDAVAGQDIAPGTERILSRDKAVIDYLQGYVRACQSAGLCEKETVNASP